MTHLLPPNLLKLFAPRAPLPYVRPVDRDISRVTPKSVSGVADILARIKEENTVGLIAAGKDVAMEEGEEPALTLAEETKREIRREERRKRKENEFKVAKETYKPSEDPEAVGDPYKTLFIGRLVRSLFPRNRGGSNIEANPFQSKLATESDLRREFEGHGVIERVRIVRDKKGRPRGYAFIVFEREREMKGSNP
ncbi:hypothetical protein SISSUDRAFT_353221 [Sistotremastrum suecicum HHB10207 ss-3]|uniref:RRM domain-containing protein n=1 Tax=Sistotremastrum suecicum HHB10207 ss-3 TaxID=1314776 RepID=A0A166G3F6_9AGAM|nr:hypothetical protein SISSUDRAFT_353221 [Sistotremastrum suecicum HHB10207 ss-3]